MRIRLETRVTPEWNQSSASCGHLPGRSEVGASPRTRATQDPLHHSSTQACRLRAWFDEPLHLIEMAGELDLASRVLAIRACTRLAHMDVADMAKLVFMDSPAMEDEHQ